MKKLKLGQFVGFLVLSIFMFSCSNELHMTLPNGPQGPQGWSAYDLWVEQVNNGSIKWDKNNVDINNFFLYLKGADGKDGQNGVDGKSAYQLWVEQVKSGIDNPHNTGTNWSVDNISMQDFWYFLTGAKGQNGSTPIIGSNGNWYIDGKDTGLPSKGKDGIDGSVVSIGSNGNWFINGKDTGVPTTGKDGQNGTNGTDGSVVSIGSNGNWFINGKDTGVPTTGKDGQNGTNGTNGSVVSIGSNGNWFINGKDTGIPTTGKDGQDGTNGADGSVVSIGSNGNWFINGKDTGVPTTGKDGQNGTNGTDGSVVSIGTNGNWYINGVDTTVPAFGKDGQNGSDGQNGANGLNGKSAYELWVQEVAKGLEDPHNPGTQWDKSKTTTIDFWEYLRGADGNDGKDGADGSPGEIGKPGQPVTIVKGKPNVIAQYSAQEFSEYVRWTDGGVAFLVYDDQGTLSPGAKVKGLPGVLDSNKVYTADERGQFIVPKEDLPLDKVAADRFGTTTEVEYLKSTGATVKEVSAPNTYVPSRMQIRIRLTNNITLDSSDENVYYAIERKVDKDKDWERIPSYLGSLFQYVKAYELSNMNDPTSYSQTSRVFYKGNTSVATGTSAYVKRLVKQSDYVLSETYPWDGNDHYFNMILESYYGETPHANVVIKMAPIQYGPILKNLKAYSYSSTLKVFSQIEGEFDFGVIDQTILFNTTLTTQSKTVGTKTFNYYYPELVNITSIQSSSFNTFFAVSTNIANNTLSSTLASPSFKVLTPYIDSNVVVTAGNSNFKTFQNYSSNARSYGFIGNLTEQGGLLKVVGLKNSSYNFPDIPVQQIP